jgi:hypothetical protein
MHSLLRAYMDNHQPEDILVFYFSGHGCLVSGNKLGFCMKDTGIANGTIYPISVLKFQELLETIYTKNIYPVFIIDACFSGAAKHTTEEIEKTLKDAGRPYLVFASCSELQKSGDTIGGGVFTKTFHDVAVAGMKDAKGRREPFITFTNLESHLQKKLAKNAPWAVCKQNAMPEILIRRNVGYKPQVETFVPYMAEIIRFLGNKHSKTCAISELDTHVGKGAYGNHSKLSLAPWNLVKDGSKPKTRTLTDDGLKFADGKIRIPKVIQKDPNTGEWRDAGMGKVFINDV